MGSFTTEAKMIRSLSLLLALLLVASRASACCDTVRFDSTGLLAESENAVIIGTYEYVPDADGGYYECTKNGLYLYYYESRGRWQIGDGPESSPAYAWCYEAALCPEELGPNWEYYAFNSGEWIADPDISVTCQ